MLQERRISDPGILTSQPGRRLPEASGNLAEFHRRELEQVFPLSDITTYPIVKTYPIIPGIVTLRGAQVPLRSLTRADMHSIAAGGYTDVWLLGLEARSEESRRLAENRVGQIKEIFPGVPPEVIKEECLVGSAFAPVALTPDPSLARSWAEVRDFADAMRKETGVKVWGDFISNHLAIDSPIVRQHPEYFIHRKTAPSKEEERDFFTIEKKGVTYWIAKGRWSRHGSFRERPPKWEEDTPWEDTAQWYILHPKVQTILIENAYKKGRIFDGIRVDAAALSDEDVFIANWGDLVPGDLQKIKNRLKEHPEERLWTRIVTAMRQGAADAGRKITITGETFHNFGVYNQLANELGQVYDEGWHGAFIHAANREYDDGLKRQVEVPDLAGWLYPNLGTLRRKTMYPGNHDQPSPIDSLQGQVDRAIAVSTAMKLLPSGAFLEPPLGREGYSGGVIDVCVRRLPIFETNAQVEIASDTVTRVKRSALFQDPNSTYTIPRVWQSIEDHEPRFHQHILPMQVTSADGKEGAITAVNLHPDTLTGMHISLPPNAIDIQVFDLATGKLVRKIPGTSELNNDRLYIELGPKDGKDRRIAQIVHYRISEDPRRSAEQTVYHTAA